MRSAMLGLPLVFLAGCANQSALVAQLDGCGLLTEGEIGPSITRAIYAPDGCYQDCLGGASCEELTAAVCRTSLDLLIACDQRCALRCGDGTLLGIERRCDGVAQCMDGADEAGCPGVAELTCNDGTRVMGRLCDGISTCLDGTDEADCVRDTCDGWRTLWPWDYCDGYAACSDGRDEAGCPTHTCADGTEVTHRPGETLRCDGAWRCRDGSDEQGCATLRPCGG